MKISQPEITQEVLLGLLVKMETMVAKLFSQTNKAQLIPMFANVFLQSYLFDKCVVFPQEHASKIMRHLSLWLVNRKFA